MVGGLPVTSKVGSKGDQGHGDGRCEELDLGFNNESQVRSFGVDGVMT